MKDILLDTQKALDFLLYKAYSSEFIEEDGYTVHPRYNYWDWLYRKGIISKEDNDLKQEEIKNEQLED